MSKDCVLAALCMSGIVAFGMALMSPTDALLKQNNAMMMRQAKQLDAAQDDLLAAKKLELQALETARVAEQALADAKKKLASCR